MLSAIVASVWIWSSHRRFYIANGGKGDIYAYRIDRKTGEMWKIVRGKITRMDLGYTIKIIKLPDEILENITGKSKYEKLNYEEYRLNIELQNDTVACISKILIEVTVYDKAGDKLWVRDFLVEEPISPYESKTLKICAGIKSIHRVSWKIKAAFGYKEESLL